MAMFLAAPKPVNLELLIESTIDWLDRRAAAAGEESGGGLPLTFRWGFRLWPPRCLICGGAADLRYLDMCRGCLRALPFIDGGVTDRPPHAKSALREVVPRDVVPLRYAPPVDEGLRALKFHADWRWAALFGALLAGWAHATGALPVSLLVPMPLHATRRAERGFNQAAQIAKFAAIWLGVPVNERVLLRARPTRAQTTLSAMRRRSNVHGAFVMHPAFDYREGLSTDVALIDDVRTTGATLDAASAALGSVPGLFVQRWAVASTMPTNTANPA